MVNITAADVNKLRQITGAGMMDCKVALQEAEGDTEKAIDILRKKGQKVAAKRADRDANQGYVVSGTTPDQTYAAVVMVNCETDFVGKNDEFIQFAKDVLDAGINARAKDVAGLLGLNIGPVTIDQKLNEMLGKTGEKVQIAHYEIIEAPQTFAYNHHGNRLATVIGVTKAGVPGIEEIGREVAMQVAAMNPVAVDVKDVDPKTIEREIEIGKEQARQEGKPEDMLEKIAMGKLNRFYKENTLLNQEFIRDSKKTVKQYLSEADKDLTVTGFKRLMLGA
jgi:elongation factor Ts